MKVLLLTTHLNVGGIGVYTTTLARYLKKEGVDVTIASSGGDLEERLKLDGVRHIKIDIKTKSEFGFKVWKALPALNQLVKEEKFEIIHAQTRVAQVLAYLSSKVTAVPFISTCHGFFKYQRISRKVLPCWGEKVIAISESVKRHLVEDFHVAQDKTVLIYNGIELAGYSSGDGIKDTDLIKSLGLKDGDLVVGTIGRLSPVKGYKYLVSAFSDILLKNERLQLLFVGEGPEERHLKQQVEELGIKDKVVFDPGRGPLKKYLALIDVFCLPSVHEGLGLSLMEAMASGKACVASKVGGLAELITDEENGLLVAPENARDLGAAISRLLEDVQFRQELAHSAKNKAMKSFSIVESAKKTAEAYEEVLDPKA